MGNLADLRALAPLPPPRTGPESWTDERVLAIRHWTPRLLSFRTTRYRSFRFTPGHYARLALGDGEARVWRPYSMVSAATDEHLEFVAIRVPGGAFSEHLAGLREGDAIRIDKAAYGFLTLDPLAPGRDLWLLASGTGIGPFVSILRDPATWLRFRRLIVVHSVRQAAELVYREEIAALPPQMRAWTQDAGADGRETALAELVYLPVATREPGATPLDRRLPQLLAEGALERAAGVPLDVAMARVLVCGNPEMTRELRQQLGARGLAPARRGQPGQMAFEKYW